MLHCQCKITYKFNSTGQNVERSQARALLSKLYWVHANFLGSGISHCHNRSQCSAWVYIILHPSRSKQADKKNITTIRYGNFQPRPFWVGFKWHRNCGESCRTPVSSPGSSGHGELLSCEELGRSDDINFSFLPKGLFALWRLLLSFFVTAVVYYCYYTWNYRYSLSLHLIAIMIMLHIYIYIRMHVNTTFFAEYLWPDIPGHPHVSVVRIGGVQLL